MPVLNPTRLAELGRQLYAERFRNEYEPEHRGEYLAIDVEAKTAYLGQTPAQALKTAEDAHRNGFFYLARIGFPSVYHLRSGRSPSRGWLFR